MKARIQVTIRDFPTVPVYSRARVGFRGNEIRGNLARFDSVRSESEPRLGMLLLQLVLAGVAFATWGYVVLILLLVGAR